MPYELGVASGLMPVYIRGLAYLEAHDGPRAQIEFEKIIAHPGALLTSPIGPLAHLQLARAYTLQGQRSRAKAAYLDFLTKWADADPDVPVLLAAKAEYRKQSEASTP